MSATAGATNGERNIDQHNGTSTTPRSSPPVQTVHQNYKGFVGGVFSGIAKLSVGHPFDTIKTLRHEGIRGLYKGATPPLVGWMFMDSVMLGSLTFYRRLLHESVFNPSPLSPSPQGFPSVGTPITALPPLGHAFAGVMAGWTVSFIAAPVEHIKARLQIQYSSDKRQRLYSGPIDCARKLYRGHGLAGLYHGLGATLLFRSFFFFWWGSYDVFTKVIQTNLPNLSAPAMNFWAGGLSAQIFWITSYPSDVVKQRIMTDSLERDRRKFWTWRDAARGVYRESGWRGYWRGFLPCFLRAFPANAVALVAFEGVMRALP